jgi:hypothetical protein
MLALLGAIFFFVALLFDWTTTAGGTIINTNTLLLLGLICLALHMAGIFASHDWRSRSTYRRRRR